MKDVKCTVDNLRKKMEGNVKILKHERMKDSKLKELKNRRITRISKNE